MCLEEAQIYKKGLLIFQCKLYSQGSHTFPLPLILPLSILQWDDLLCHTAAMFSVQSRTVTMLVGDLQQRHRTAARNVLSFPFSPVPPSTLRILGLGYKPAKT